MAPKEQKSKEAKAIAAANSSKGKKKVRFVWSLGGVLAAAGDRAAGRRGRGGLGSRQAVPGRQQRLEGAQDVDDAS